MKLWHVLVAAALMVSALAYLGKLGPVGPGKAAVPGIEPGVNGEWIEDAEQAARMAMQSKRPLMVFYTGSDWCVWCKRLEKETFGEPAWKAYAALKLVLLKLDFPKQNAQPEARQRLNRALHDRHQVENRFPTIVFLDPAGKELGRMGYFPGGPELFIPALERAMDPNDPSRGPRP